MKAVTVLVLMTVSAVFSQPESFRSLSTSGMILDDIDLWVNGILSVQPVPDRVLEVDGYRVYTGLANLATGKDRAFDELKDGEGGFMVGGSAPFEASAMAAGALTGFYDSRIFEEITLLGPGGVPFITGTGEVEGTWSEYVDTNGDGTYDANHTVYQSAHGWIDSTRTDAGVVFGWSPKDHIQIGLAVSYFTESLLDEPSTTNFQTTVTDTNLVSGIPTFGSDITSTGSTEDNFGGFGFAVSGRGIVSEGMTLGGMLMFAPLSGDHTESGDQSGFEDWIPGEPAVHDDVTWTTTEGFTLDLGGQRMGGGAVATWLLSDVWKVDLGGAYYITGADGSSDGYTLQTDSLIMLTTGSLTSTDDFDKTGTGNTGMDLSDNLMVAGIKATAEPVDMMTVSLGLFFSRSDETTTLSTDADFLQVETYDDGDVEVSDPDDFVATTTWSQNIEEKTTLETTRIAAPVGIEVGVLPMLTVRLGASPAFVWETKTETVSLIDASPMATHTVYGDGTETYTTEDPWVTFNGTRVSTEDTRTEIPLTYGMGFSPNDFIAIDLMGLGYNLSEWRVSATLSF